MKRMTAEAANMTIKENKVFVMIFSSSMISQIPRIATIVKSKTQAIKMYETVFFIGSIK